METLRGCSKLKPWNLCEIPTRWDQLTIVLHIDNENAVLVQHVHCTTAGAVERAVVEQCARSALLYTGKNCIMMLHEVVDTCGHQIPAQVLPSSMPRKTQMKPRPASHSTRGGLPELSPHADSTH